MILIKAQNMADLRHQLLGLFSFSPKNDVTVVEYEDDNELTLVIPNKYVGKNIFLLFKGASK